MNTIAIIPARGGSKGIPRKNVALVGGKPLLVWNIEAALEAELIDEVYVSTDDAEIAEVAAQSGAHVIKRPADLAGDSASSESALLHALELLKNQGEEPDLLVFMQCTSPLTAAIDIDDAVLKLVEEQADSCLTVTDFHYFLWKENADGMVEEVNHDKHFRPRRQDREPQYVENGAIYVVKVPGFLESKHRFFGKTVLSVMPSERCFEIDDDVDMEIAEGMLQRRTRSSTIRLPSPLKAVLFDFDGVFTDNKVYVDEEGTETVRCDRSDGWGLAQLKKSGLQIAVLSTEENPVVSARCDKLGINCYQGLGENKFDAFKKWCAENNILSAEVVFVGNDVNDLECLGAAGCGVAPADAHPDVLKMVDHVLRRCGGDACVRELCDMVLKEN